VDLPWE